MSGKRDRYSLELKLDILKDVKDNIPYDNIVKKYGLKGKSNVTRIKKQEKEIMGAYNLGSHLGKKSLKKTKYEVVEQKTIAFVNEMTDKGVNVTHEWMLTKAKQAIEEEGITDLKGSKGYIQGLARRNNISLLVKHGDASSVDQATVNDWKVKLAHFIKDYSDDDVFNADELALFFGLLPSKTIAVKGKKLLNGKGNKLRISLLVGANMSGTEKLAVLVIGRSENPRCFKGLKEKPLKYRANKTAWMTSVIFAEYMKSLDRKFSLQKRKVIFFIDNCPAHPASLMQSLKNIKLVFLPKNCTSVLQPMDMGIIRSFKCKYRTMLLTHIIKEIEGKEIAASDIKIDLLMVMNWIKFAWESVAVKTIVNCFKKAFFVRGEASPEDDLVLEKDEEDVANLLSALGEGIDATDYITADDLVTAVNPTREEQEEDSETEIECEDVDEEEEEAVVKPTMKEAFAVMETITRLYFHENFVSHQDFDKFERAFVKLSLESMKQKKITDYFTKK